MTLHDERASSPEVDASPLAQSTGGDAPDPPPPAPAIQQSLAVEARIARLAREVRLSLRERTVLRLIALGYRYREIGCAMSISPRTVKMYATNLRRKVGGDSRWDLMRRVLAE